MYTWNIKVILHNGKEIEGLYNTNCGNSQEVFKEIMGGEINQGSYSVITGADSKSAIYVKTLEIDYIQIGIFK